MPPSNPHTARPTPLACLECRRKHLRCDGDQPTCTRCLSRSIFCDYTPSRRGCRRKGKQTAPITQIAPQASTYQSSEQTQWNALSATSQIEATDEFTFGPAALEPPLRMPTESSETLQHNEQSPWHDNEQLVNLYYLNFHAGSPILVSKSLYWQRHYPRFLKAVVESIGSLFSQTISSDELRDVARRELEAGRRDVPEMVQALLLFSIALSASDAADQGRRMLTEAIDIAISLGMHHRDYVAPNVFNQRAEEESMRRTWYELYISDGCSAAFQRLPSFKMNGISADVLLPCEDGAIDGDTYPCATASREDFENSTFSNDDIIFSSFCYRIEAVRLLGRVLAITGTHAVHRDRVQAADNALAAFIHHLPPSKSEPEIINTYGELDELMFQTHAIMQYAIMLLHFPRSDLSSSISTTNAVPGGNGGKIVCPCSRQRVHAAKAIEASKAICMLAALRSSIQGHCPFFIHCLALGAVVQMSVSANHSRGSVHCLEQHYERVKLMLGVLKSFSRNWAIAGVMLRALNKMASVIFQPLRQHATGISQQDVDMNEQAEVCSYDTPASGILWQSDLDLQDIQELVGLGANDFCL
ncbi:hypothetical protein DE146DRAFT_605246 [Phaeosphaeria sp. MPI-PUGE-AT-0046c]|nr:hypothetical protein DE146DRAFT_605246 [Phaeosphaeria sp. MPI-PUGE-AT-0046c]